MAQIKITFEDPSDPPNPGMIRIYSDPNSICCTDQGERPANQVQAGWRLRRDPREPWLTVLSVVTE